MQTNEPRFQSLAQPPSVSPLEFTLGPRFARTRARLATSPAVRGRKNRRGAGVGSSVAIRKRIAFCLALAMRAVTSPLWGATVLLVKRVATADDL